MAKVWTETEEQVVREYAPHYTVTGLAEILDRTEGSVRGKAQVLGVKVTTGGSKIWTDDEERFLRDVYADYPIARVAKALGRSENAVFKKASGLGAKRKQVSAKA